MLTRRQALLQLGLLATAPAVPGTAQRPPARWAVLVGVSQYWRPPTLTAGAPNPDDLRGPANSVRAFQELLQGKYGLESEHLRVLVNAQATLTNILAAWDWLQQSAQPGDQALFYFCGHGTRVRRAVADPVLGTYTTGLCPHDARRTAPGCGLLPGPLLRQRIDALKTQDVIVLIDACHSGSATRAPLRLRETYFMDVPEAAPTPAPEPTARRPEVLLAAADLQEEASGSALLPPQDRRDPRCWMSGMTYFMLDELRADTASTLTWQQLAARLRTRLLGEYGKEASTPQLQGPDTATTPVLALRRPGLPLQPTLPVVAEVGAALPSGAAAEPRVRLQPLGGATLAAGDILQALPAAPDGSRRWRMVEATDGFLRVVLAGGGAAEATVVSGTVVAGQRCVRTSQGLPDPQALRVFIGGPAAAQVPRPAIAGVVYAQRLEGAEVALQADSVDSVAVYRQSLPLGRYRAAEVPALLDRLASVLPLMLLRNTLPTVRLTLVADGAEVTLRRRIGATVGFTVTASQSGFVTLLGLGADGTITGLDNLPVRAGEPLVLPPTTVTGPAGIDMTKALWSAQALTLTLPETTRAFREGGSDARGIARQVRLALREGVNALQARGQDFRRPGQSVPPAIATQGWASAELFLEIVE
jgi:hypothetical protein